MPRKPRYDTEAKQRKAIRMLKAGDAAIDDTTLFDGEIPDSPTTVVVYGGHLAESELIATFDLSKFPKMRKPLRGVRKLQKEIKRMVR